MHRHTTAQLPCWHSCDGTTDLLLLMCSEGVGVLASLYVSARACERACVYTCSCARTCLLMCLCVRVRASVLHLGRVKELSGQITSLALLGFLCLSVSAQMKICSTQIARVPSHRFLGNPSCLKPPVAVLFNVRECVRVRVCVCRCMHACVFCFW